MNLDIGCGRNKKEGFIGIDIDPDRDADIISTALHLPIKDSIVDKINCSHFLEHLYPEEAQKLFDEIFRILRGGGKAALKVDRDWRKWLLLQNNPTQKHRYSVKELKK